MTICFPYSRPLCDLPRPHLQMLLYIQRTKPSSSILPMIRMPRMLPLVSSTIQQLVELPTECTMAQSIAGPGKYCTRKVKCHPSRSHAPREKATPPSVPARLPTQKQFWARWSASNDAIVAKLLPLSKRQRYFSRIVTQLGLVPFDDCEQRLTNTYALSETFFNIVKIRLR